MNENAIELIKEFEQLYLEAYLCPAGVWTIGWGHTKGVKAGMKITEREAEKLLEQDMMEVVKVLEDVVCRLSIDQYNALVSFVFNIGVAAYRKSTLRKMVLANPENPKIADEMKKWKYATNPKTKKKEVLPGLVRRREREAELYFTSYAPQKKI
jgi:lysozyme